MKIIRMEFFIISFLLYFLFRIQESQKLLEEENQEENILFYNDEWEEMANHKYLRWILYYSKKTTSFIRSRIFNCCRRENHEFNKNVKKLILIRIYL